MKKQQRKSLGLGRGLDSLISEESILGVESGAISNISIDLIRPNPDQPRTHFDAAALDELASSIRELGIIQPLTLRVTDDGSYEVISGERRLRAAKKAGLTEVPAYVRAADEQEVTEMALIENIQREDLNAIEIALTFRKLIDQYHLTQERLSERVGKKRTTIANFLRLLKLPAEIQIGLRDGKVDMGHARALLAVDDPKEQLKLYNLAVKEGLSVRQVEQLVKQRQDEPAPAKPAPVARIKAADYDVLRKHLSQSFGVNVQFACDTNGKGRITFPFNNEQELERIIAIFDEMKQR